MAERQERILRLVGDKGGNASVWIEARGGSRNPVAPIGATAHEHTSRRHSELAHLATGEESAGLYLELNDNGSAVIGEAVARFDANTEHHHHLVCLGCDRISDLEDLKLAPINLPDPRRTGFEIADYSIHFEGYCAECRRKKTSRLRPESV